MIAIQTRGMFGTVTNPGGMISGVAIRPAIVALNGVEQTYQVGWGASGKSVKWRVLDKDGLELMPMSAVGVIEFAGGAYGVPITITTSEAAYVEFWQETDNFYLQQPVTVIDIEQAISTSPYGELVNIPVAGTDMTLSAMIRSVFQYFLRKRTVKNIGSGNAIETMKKADGSNLAAANIVDDGTIFNKNDVET